MLELSNIPVEKRFRGHHAPNFVFRLLVNFGTRSWPTIEQCEAPISDLISNSIKNGPLYIMDLTGSQTYDFNKLLVHRDRFLVSISTLLSGEPNQAIIIGKVKDDMCNACVIGAHCVAITETSSDTTTALKLKTFSNNLGFPCVLLDTPDDIYESTDSGLRKGMVVQTPLWVLRKFIFTRAIFVTDEVELLRKQKDHITSLSDSIERDDQLSAIRMEIRRMLEMDLSDINTDKSRDVELLDKLTSL